MKQMKNIQILSGLFALILVISPLSVLGQETVQEKGKIEVIDTFDWGEVAPNDELKTEIEIKNVGEGELHIKRVKPSCGCTTAPLSKDRLGPGESATMSVTLRTSAKPGPFNKRITIFSDDPTSPTTFISLTGESTQDLTFTPNGNYLIVNNGMVGEESTASVRMKNTGDKPIVVFPPQLLNGNVAVRFDMDEQKTLQPEEEIEVMVYIKPSEAGNIKGNISIETSSEDVPHKGFALYGLVREQKTDDAVGSMIEGNE